MRVKIMKKFFIALTALLIAFTAPAGAEGIKGQIVKNVASEGSCAIVEMTAEQCQLLALQRARAAVIEQASGVSVSSSTLVTNGMLAADFIKTYSKGFIVNEKAEWMPLGQYQKDKSTAPIPEYTVKITADVYVSEKKIKPIGLKAKLNSIIFKDGEKAGIDIKTSRKAKIAIFNITADDKVAMLFPNDYEMDSTISGSEHRRFPDAKSKVELVMHTLQGHKRDAEAFFIVAMDLESTSDFMGIFTPQTPMDFSSFFRKYADIADYCEDAIITYEVIKEKGD